MNIKIERYKNNFKSMLEEILKMKEEYLNDIVLITEICGDFGSTEFEILEFRYINDNPTLITNNLKDGLTGKGFTVSKLKDILLTLKEGSTLCIKLGFENSTDKNLHPLLSSSYMHCSYDLKSEETKNIYGEYAFELYV